MLKKTLKSLAISSAVLLGAATFSTAMAAPFYEGKRLETIVPYGAGGGSDVFGRYIAPYFNQHIEGNPAIQVVNVPGAGSVIGMNEYENMRDADGFSTVWSSGSTILNHLLKADGIQFDFQKLTPIIGVPAGSVVFISPDAGYKEPKDILNADLVFSGQSATGVDLIALIAFEVLDVDFLPILGYEGAGPARVAFEQGESTANMQTTAGYLSNVVPLVEEGEAIPLFTFGHFDEEGNIIRDSAFPDIPNLAEFYEEVYGERPSGTAWDAYKLAVSRAYNMQKILWIKKDAPQEAIDALKAAGEKIAVDEDFNSKGDKVLGGYKAEAGERLNTLIQNSIQAEIDPEVEAWIFKLLEEKYDQ